jgi:hypothetical protein
MRSRLRRSVWVSRNRWLFAAAMLGAWSNASAISKHAHHYSAVVEAVSVGDLYQRRLYAQVAVAALIRVNKTEVDRAHQLNSVRRPTSWAAGAQAYLATLEDIAADIPTAREIEVVREPYGAVRLAIDQAQVILSSPRLSRQSELDETILEEICAVIECPTAPVSFEERLAAQVADVRREWHFSDRGPPMLSASDGLHCVFPDQHHLQLNEATCETAMRELRLTAEGLRALIQHGGWINWRAFAIVNADAGQQVVFDTTGTRFDLRLPLLGQAEAVWRGAIPWLQARLRGYSASYLIKIPAGVAYSEP